MLNALSTYKNPDSVEKAAYEILKNRSENKNRKAVEWTHLLYQENSKPEDRVELRLVVTGSVLEDDNQQGLAHFIEHMAFNGTEEFCQK